MEEGTLKGLVSVGDVLKAGLKTTADTNKHLMEYIYQ